MKFFFALVGVALAAHSSLPTSPLAINKEFTFRYDGAISSGIPVDSDAAVTRVQADVIIQVTENSAILQLRNVQMAGSTVFVAEKIEEFDSLEKREISAENIKQIELPVRFRYEHGIVSEIQFAEEDQPWSANIKRAVLNMIQMKMDEEKVFVETEETTLEGKCAVIYTADKEEKKITKTIDYSKCVDRVDTIYGMRYVTSTSKFKGMVPQTEFTYAMEEKQLKEVTVKSTYNLLFKDEKHLKTEVMSRLTLTETKEIESPMVGPSGRKEHLIYSNEWERMIEKFCKNGETDDNQPFESFPAVERAQQVVNEMNELKENDAEMVRQMARLVRVMRMSTAEELVQIHDKVYKDARRSVKDIMDHSLAIAGTKNTVEHLIRHIEDKEISAKKAALLLKTVQETPFASEKIAMMVLELANSDICRNEPVLRQSAWLAFGAIVRGVVAPTNERHLVQENTKEIKNKFHYILKKQLEKADNKYDKVLALKTIANSALDITILDLEKMIMNKKESITLRVEAINALRILTQQMPRKVQRMMMRVLVDEKERADVRTAAFVRVLYTIPEKTTLLHLVTLMNTTPNKHLANFMYYTMNSLSHSSFPGERVMINNVAELMKSANQYRPTSSYDKSFMMELPWFSQEWASGAHINYGSVFASGSILPKEVTVEMETMFIGMWNQYLAQVGFTQENAEQMINLVHNKLKKEEKNSRGLRNERVNNGINLVEKIAEKLNIRARERNSEEPFAMVYFRYKQMDYAVIPIDEQIIDNILETYLSRGTIDTQLLETMLNFNIDFDGTSAAFIFEITRSIPTAFGVPLTFTVKAPTVMRGQGKISAEKINFGLRLKAEVNPAIAATTVCELRSWTPLFEQGVKSVRHVGVTIPVDVQLEVTVRETVEISLHVGTPEEKQPLVHIHSQPVAFQRFPDPEDMAKYVEIEEKTIFVPQWEQQVRVFNTEVMLADMKFVATGHKYNAWTPENVLYGEFDYVLTVEPTRRTPKEIIFRTKISFDFDAKMEKPKSIRMLKNELELENERQENIRQIARGIKNGRKLTITGSMETNEKSEFTVEIESDLSMKFWRMESSVVVPSQSGRSWKWEQLVEVFIPRGVSTIQELKELTARDVIVISSSKWGSEKRNEIVVRMHLEQSPEQKNWAGRASQNMNGMEEHELLVRAATLNRISAVAKYQIVAETETNFDFILDVMRAYGFWSSQTELRNAEEKIVRASLTVDPFSRKHLNISVETARIRMTERIQIPIRLLLPTIANTPMRSMVKPSQCTVSRNKINTFDGVIYKAPITDCYSVLAKDCSKEARYAVLIKKTTDKTLKKIIKTVQSNEEIIMQLFRGQIEVRRDNKLIPEVELQDYKIERINSRMIVQTLGPIRVHFDGFTVKIESPASEMDVQCGLCGHYDGDRSNIFRTANDYETDNVEEFHRSYIVKNEECDAEETRISDKKNYKVYDYAENYEDKEYNYKQDYAYEEKNSEKEYDYKSGSKDYEGESSKDYVEKEKNQKDYKEYDRESKISNDYERESPKKISDDYDNESSKDYVEKTASRDHYDDEEDTIEPVKRNLVIEKSHRVCISIEPVAECPPRSIPAKKTDEKVKFACLPRHKPETRELLKKIAHKPMVLQHVVNLIDVARLPKTCTRN